MQKWEYKLIYISAGKDRKDVLNEINEAGNEGWRIVPADTLLSGIIMEREIPSTMTTQEIMEEDRR